jgi:hypothetical protein
MSQCEKGGIEPMKQRRNGEEKWATGPEKHVVILARAD